MMCMVIFLNRDFFFLISLILTEMKVHIRGVTIKYKVFSMYYPV